MKGAALKLACVGLIAALSGCAGTGSRFGVKPLVVEGTEYAARPGAPQVPVGLFRPTPYEDFLEVMKGLAAPVTTRVWHYDMGEDRLAAVFLLEYRHADNVAAVVTGLAAKAKPVTFFDYKTKLPTAPPERTADVLPLGFGDDPATKELLRLVVAERSPGTVLYETMYFRQALGQLCGQTALNRDQYYLVASDPQNRRIAVYVSAWVGEGPMFFPDDSPERSHNGFVYEIMRANQ